METKNNDKEKMKYSFREKLSLIQCKIYILRFDLMNMDLIPIHIFLLFQDIFNSTIYRYYYNISNPLKIQKKVGVKRSTVMNSKP